MFGLLVKVRVLSLWNVARFNASRHKLLTAGLTLFGAALFAGIYLAFRLFLSLVHSPGDLRELVYEVFFFLFLFLLAGAVPFVASTLLHSSDYLLLSAAPVHPRAIVAAKLLDATVTNSIQFTMIGIPAIAACGAALELPPAGWALVPLVVALFVLLPALVTALLLLIALAAVGMRRVRSAITAVNAIMASVVCITIVVQAGRLQLHHNLRDGFQHGFHTAMTAGANNPFGAVGPSSSAAQVSPSGPFAQALIDIASGDTGAGLQRLALIAALIGLLYLACMQWGGRLLNAAALAEEGEGAAPAIVGSGQIRPHRRGLLTPFSSPVAALIVKDLRYVLRDSVLLSQLGMPIILFFVPFVIVIQQEAMQGLGAINSPGEVYPFAAAMTGIIIFMQTSIISLTSIGIESRSFWLVLTSPNNGRTLLWAKFVMSTLVSAGVGMLLTATSAVVFQASMSTFLVQSGIVVLCSAALCGMGVGISAALPRFVYDNPAHRVSAWALILGFFATIAYLTVVGILAAFAWYTSMQLSEQAALIWGVSAAVYLTLSLLAVGIPLAIGARRIEVYQWEH